MKNTGRLSENSRSETKATRRLTPPAPGESASVPSGPVPSGPVRPVNAAAPARKAARWPRALAWATAVAAVLLLGVLVAGYTVYARWRSSEYIAPHIVIRDEPVGGLTRAAARQRLEERFGRLFVSLRTPARSYRLSLKQLGGEPQIDNVVDEAYAIGRTGNWTGSLLQLARLREREQRLKLPMRWDKEQLKRTVWTIAFDYRRPPRDARLRMTDAGMQVVAHQEGRRLNVGATLLDLQRQYYIGVDEIEAVTLVEMPRVTTADLAGHDELLGTYTTSFNDGIWGRTRNIYVAAEQLDGQVLMPGEEFSFNKMTGRRTYAKGYRMAKIFERKPGEVKSEIVDGLAGGVCQVSSTLYNAVRDANQNHSTAQLRITERNFHSLPVTYVPPGRDATVAWPNRDFRFRNTFAHPVYVRARVAGSRLKISIWQRVPDKAVAVASTPGDRTGGENS